MGLDANSLTVVFGGITLAALVALFFALSRKERTEDEARAYLAGVSYVISGDPDAAISALSKAAQLSRQTLDTYFAMGALFRRKGEFDRAIRLHRNILLRPGLAPEVKRRAELALALDYRRSGLGDQAAETLRKLLDDEPKNAEALLEYRRVLEAAGDWAAAIAIQARLVELEGKGREVLAHLLSELARAEPDHPESEALARRAVDLSSRSADAQLALGEVLLARGQGSPAGAALTEACRLEPELAPRVAPKLALAIGPEAAEAFWRTDRASGGAAFGLALARHLREHRSVSSALEVLRPLIDRHPHFWDARKELGRLLVEGGPSDELRADYLEILGALGQPTTAFACQLCRQKLPDHRFRCPACEAWDSVAREGAEPRI